MKEKETIMQELRKAWDALESLSVRGYDARARVQAAQEAILAVYNEMNRVEPEDTAKAGGEGKDGDD